MKPRSTKRPLLSVVALGLLAAALAGCSNNVRSTPVHMSVGVGYGGPWWGYRPYYRPIYVGGGGFPDYPDVDIPEATPLPSVGFEDYGGFDDY